MQTNYDNSDSVPYSREQRWVTHIIGENMKCQDNIYALARLLVISSTTNLRCNIHTIKVINYVSSRLILTQNINADVGEAQTAENNRLIAYGLCQQYQNLTFPDRLRGRETYQTIKHGLPTVPTPSRKACVSHWAALCKSFKASGLRTCGTLITMH